MAQESAASETQQQTEAPAAGTSTSTQTVGQQAAGNFDVIREFQGQIKSLEEQVTSKDAALKAAQAKLADLEPVALERDRLKSELAAIASDRHLGKVRETIRRAAPGVDDLTVDGLIHRAGDKATDPAKEAELAEYLKPELEKLRKANEQRVANTRRASPHPTPSARPRSFGI